MHEPVDPLLDANEDAEVGNIAHRPLDEGTDRIFFLGRFPGIGHYLFEAKRDPAVPRIDVQHDNLYLLADLEKLGRMGHLARPGHLRDMHQALDAALELHEGAIIHQADHLALDSRADRKFFRHGMPWVGGKLFHAERNPFFLGVEFQHDDLDLFTHLDNFRRMVDSAPGHVADVQNAVDAAKIDKSAVAGDIFHRAFENHTLFEYLENILFEGVALLFQQCPA